MTITGIDVVTFGVEDMATATRFPRRLGREARR